MFKLIFKIASNLGIPFILLNNRLFYEMFSSWYFYTFHHWEYIVPEDEPFKEMIRENYFSQNDYLSDTGSVYDMHEFESYYYEYVS